MTLQNEGHQLRCTKSAMCIAASGLAAMRCTKSETGVGGKNILNAREGGTRIEGSPSQSGLCWVRAASGAFSDNDLHLLKLGLKWVLSTSQLCLKVD